MAEIGMPDGRRNTNRGARSHPAPAAPGPDPRHYKARAKAEAAAAPTPAPEAPAQAEPTPLADFAAAEREKAGEPVKRRPKAEGVV